MASCHEMRKGEVYACADCGLVLLVLKECRDVGQIADACGCHGEDSHCVLTCCGMELVRQAVLAPPPRPKPAAKAKSKKAPAKKGAAKKVPAKKAPAKRGAAKKVPAKKAPAKPARTKRARGK